jgi:hypothetical protein
MELVFLLALGFLAFWLILLLLLAVLGGWQRLATSYLATALPDGQRWRFQDCALRFGLSYNGCVQVVASREGLRLSVLFPFRPWHPPLYFPWQEVVVTRQRRWVRLRLHSEPNVPVWLRERLATKIQAAVGACWPEPALKS